MTRFIFASHPTLERWSWKTPLEVGIGMSETSHCEMAKRLAARGHEVISYAPMPDDMPSPHVHDKVHWENYETRNPKIQGIWVLYRHLSLVDEIDKGPGTQIWIVMQDVAIPDLWSKERLEKIDKVIALCQAHKDFIIEQLPCLKDKVVISSNGIDVDLIESIEEEGLYRNPHKLVYAGSPNRAFPQLFEIFLHAREFVPTLELHVFYGLDVTKKGIQTHAVREIQKQVEKYRNKPGIVWHGRQPQPRILREFASAGLWIYPTVFTFIPVKLT